MRHNVESYTRGIRGLLITHGRVRQSGLPHRSPPVFCALRIAGAGKKTAVRRARRGPQFSWHRTVGVGLQLRFHD